MALFKSLSQWSAASKACYLIFPPHLCSHQLLSSLHRQLPLRLKPYKPVNPASHQSTHPSTMDCFDTVSITTKAATAATKTIGDASNDINPKDYQPKRFTVKDLARLAAKSPALARGEGK